MTKIAQFIIFTNLKIDENTRKTQTYKKKRHSVGTTNAVDNNIDNITYVHTLRERAEKYFNHLI